MVFAIAIPNTIECNNNASQKGVSTVYIIRCQFVGVNKPSRLNAYRYHCAEGLALQCRFGIQETRRRHCLYFSVKRCPLCVKGCPPKRRSRAKMYQATFLRGVKGRTYYTKGERLGTRLATSTCSQVIFVGEAWERGNVKLLRALVHALCKSMVRNMRT